LQSRHLAEELTQSVFIRAWESLAKFRFEYRFFSWLYRIAINMALNELKKPNKHVGLEFIKNMADQSEPDIPDNQVLMTTAIHKMKTKYKMLIVLKYYQDLSYSEIAGALKISEKKVRSRLYDARLQLKTILEETGYY
jgi:RNA polymerase sigma-70 factor, ECF subfamily